MRTRTSIGVVGAALAASLGAGSYACGGSSGSTNGTGSTAGDAGPTVEAGGADGQAVVGIVPCASPMPISIAGKDTGFVACNGNVSHRASVKDCPNGLPRAGGGKCPLMGLDSGTGMGPAGSCVLDSDCTEHPFGTCGIPSGGGAAPSFCACSYGCVKDSDCAAMQICQCGDPVGTCIAATCTSDSDCTGGALCASNAPHPGSCGVAAEYSCQSAQDQCFTFDDCMQSAPIPSYAYACVQTGSGRTCQMPQCMAGRPFLVDRIARVAGTTERSDWSHGRAPDAGALTREMRRALAAHWTQVGLMEHASVAAFARFTLELAALGASAELLTASAQAMSDEVEHAKLAFALASAYAGEAIGPSALDVSGALPRVTARTTFASLVREGCIGETLAAVEATEALAAATDPAVRDALARIARDETRHSELAWKTARWLLRDGDDAFRSWARAEVATAIAERRALDLDDTRECAAHGLLSKDTRASLAADALRAIVMPLWNEVERAATPAIVRAA
jgi:hypothetical protein